MALGRRRGGYRQSGLVPEPLPGDVLLGIAEALSTFQKGEQAKEDRGRDTELHDLRVQGLAQGIQAGKQSLEDTERQSDVTDYDTRVEQFVSGFGDIEGKLKRAEEAKTLLPDSPESLSREGAALNNEAAEFSLGRARERAPLEDDLLQANIARARRPPQSGGGFQKAPISVDGEPVADAVFNPDDGLYYRPGSGGMERVTGDVSFAPTAESRDLSSRIEPIKRGMDVLQGLSQELIQFRGPVMRAVAAGQTAGSVLGNNPVYKAYQDTKEGMALSIAAVVNRGRPNDPDKQAILNMIPDALLGDTDQSSQLKWMFLRAMLGTEDWDWDAYTRITGLPKQPVGGAASDAAPSTTGGDTIQLSPEDEALLESTGFGRGQQ
jgi:hypothetical protein